MTMLAHAFTLNGAIIEVPACTTVMRTGCAIATGIKLRSAGQCGSGCNASAVLI